MKIIFISDAIYPYNKGGKEKRIYEITTRLVKYGHEVHIFTMKWWKGPNIKIENGIILHGICKLKKLYTKSGRRSIFQALYFSLKVFFPLLFTKFDIIEADQVPYFQLFTIKLATLLKRKKLFVSWLEVWGKNYWLKYMGWKGYFGYIIEKLSVFLPNHFIAISQLTKDRLIKLFSVPEKKIYYIPASGIDLKKFKNLTNKKNIDCIYFGRLLNHKNVDILIKAISILKNIIPSIECLIIGEGPEKNNLINLVEKLNIQNNIRFLDFIKEEFELFSYIKSSKVFVFPSTREGFGIAVIESNACGVPVVVIDHPENAAKNLIIENKNGYICKLDEKEIASKIKNIIKNNNLEKIKKHCIEVAKKYQWKNIINQILDFYKTI